MHTRNADALTMDGGQAVEADRTAALDAAVTAPDRPVGDLGLGGRNELAHTHILSDVFWLKKKEEEKEQRSRSWRHQGFGPVNTDETPRGEDTEKEEIDTMAATHNAAESDLAEDRAVVKVVPGATESQATR